VLRLCQQVSRYQARVLLGVGENKQLGGSRQHVNLHQPAHELLGGGHVLVAWPHNHIHSRHRPSPVRQRRDRLSTTDSQNVVSAGNERSPQHQWRRMRRGHPDVFAPCNLRRDSCHQDCRRQRITSAGRVAPSLLHGADIVTSLAHLDVYCHSLQAALLLLGELSNSRR